MQDYMVEKNQGKSVEKEAAVSDKAIQSFRKMIDLKKKNQRKLRQIPSRRPKRSRSFLLHLSQKKKKKRRKRQSPPVSCMQPAVLWF